MEKDKNTIIENLKNKRNYSWIMDVIARNSANEDNVAINYLGRNITYMELFKEVRRFATALKGCGVKKSEEIVVCMDRIPEFVYLMGAASLIGTKIRVISSNMDKNTLKACLEKSNSSLVFVSSSKLASLKDVLKEFPSKYVIPVSHNLSINEECCFRKQFNEEYNFDRDEYIKASRELDSICWIDVFLWQGKDYRGEILDRVNFLDDAFTITYTEDGKEVVRPNGYYIMRGEFLDKDEIKKKLGIYKGAKVYSNMPTSMESFLTLVISNTLTQGGTLVLDPVEKQEYFSKAIEMYQPMTNITTTDIWVESAYKYFNNKERYFFGSSMYNIALGSVSWGEEHIINRYLTRTDAGVSVTGLEDSIAKISVGGYDGLMGDYGLVLARTWLNPKVSMLDDNIFLGYEDSTYNEVLDPMGIIPHEFVEVRVLSADKRMAAVNHYGYVYCHTPWISANYDNKFNQWVCIGYGYKDENGAITLKDKKDINKSFIASAIDKDIKNIMSCEVVSTRDKQGEEVYVAFVRLQPKVMKWQQRKIMEGIYERCLCNLPDHVLNNLYIRFINSYPVTKDGVRDIKDLEKIGLIGASPLSTLLPAKGRVRQKNKRK